MSFSIRTVIILVQPMANDFSFIHILKYWTSDFRPQEETRKPGAATKAKGEDWRSCKKIASWNTVYQGSKGLFWLVELINYWNSYFISDICMCVHCRSNCSIKWSKRRNNFDNGRLLEKRSYFRWFAYFDKEVIMILFTCLKNAVEFYWPYNCACHSKSVVCLKS